MILYKDNKVIHSNNKEGIQIKLQILNLQKKKKYQLI